MKTREQKVARIYEVMADKTLSFGCKFGDFQVIIGYCVESTCESNDGTYLTFPHKNKTKEKIAKEGIIGHPVMIGDVLEWFQETYGNDQDVSHLWKVTDDKEKFPLCPSNDNDIHSDVFLCGYIQNLLLGLWRYKRLQIEEQSDDCIDFIYSLITNEPTNT